VSENTDEYPPRQPGGRHAHEGIEYLGGDAFLRLLTGALTQQPVVCEDMSAVPALGAGTATWGVDGQLDEALPRLSYPIEGIRSDRKSAILHV